MIPARDDRGELKVRGMWGGKWNKNPNARAIILTQLYEPVASYGKIPYFRIDMMNRAPSATFEVGLDKTNDTKWYYSLRVVGLISYCKKRFYPRINAHFFMRSGMTGILPTTSS